MTPRPTLYLFCRGKIIGRGRSPRLILVEGAARDIYNVGHGVVRTSVLLYPNIHLPHHLHTTPWQDYKSSRNRLFYRKRALLPAR